MALFQKEEHMKLTNKVMAKWVLILLGMTLGIECFDSIRRPIDVQMEIIKMAIANYIAQEGTCPVSLDTLVQKRYFWEEKYLVDPWGEAIGHEYSGDENFVVWSLGPDKKSMTKDDIIRAYPSSYAESWKAKHVQPDATSP